MLRTIATWAFSALWIVSSCPISYSQEATPQAASEQPPTAEGSGAHKQDKPAQVLAVAEADLVVVVVVDVVAAADKVEALVVRAEIEVKLPLLIQKLRNHHSQLAGSIN